MKYLTAVIFICFLMPALSAAGEPVELTGLNNPTSITILGDEIYIVDGITVNVFSKKDYSKKVSFGKSGTGPGEFQSGRRRGGGGPVIFVYPDDEKILVYNRRRHLYFSKDGKYIKEKNIGKRTSALTPFSGGYLGTQFGRQGNKFFMKFLWFDNEYKSGKPISEIEIDAGRRFNIFGRDLKYTTIGKSIFLADRSKPVVGIYDTGSRKLGEIKVDMEKRELRSADAKQIEEYFKDQLGAERFNRVKRFMDIPSNYPAFMSLDTDGKYIYMITWNRKEGKNKILVYNNAGKPVKTIYANVEMVSAVAPYPIEIFEGNMYQLIENDDTEEWDLHEVKLM